MGTAPVKGSARLSDLVRRPQLSYGGLKPFDPERPELSPAVQEAVEVQVKYAGYIQRQLKQVEQFKKEESRLLPQDIDYSAIQGLRLEARQKLGEIRPMNLGQASRISGVSPADLAVLMVYLELRSKEENGNVL
jgi:tRNA uridine 5-carboxymethylaminomethyl modification enzyme